MMAKLARHPSAIAAAKPEAHRHQSRSQIAGPTASGCVTPYRVTRMPRGGHMRVVRTRSAFFVPRIRPGSRS
jgi:hypothetical protein